MTDERELLPIWVVHPADFPHCYVARKWLSLPQPRATADMLISANLDDIHEALEELGFTHLSPMPGDDPKIIETWV